MWIRVARVGTVGNLLKSSRPGVARPGARVVAASAKVEAPRVGKGDLNARGGGKGKEEEGGEGAQRHFSLLCVTARQRPLQLGGERTLQLGRNFGNVTAGACPPRPPGPPGPRGRSNWRK